MNLNIGSKLQAKGFHTNTYDRMLVVWLHGNLVLVLERPNPVAEWRYDGRIVTESEIFDLIEAQL